MIKEMAKTHKELNIREHVSASVTVNGVNLGDCHVYCNDKKDNGEIILILKDKTQQNTIQIIFSKPVGETK